MNFLGFVPVSPDDSAYVFDKRKGEVVNERHGSLRRPRLHAGIGIAGCEEEGIRKRRGRQPEHQQQGKRDAPDEQPCRGQWSCATRFGQMR